MSKLAARVGDQFTHAFGTGVITSGAPNVFINKMPAAVVATSTLAIPGAVSVGSTKVFIGGMPAAQVGSATTCSLGPGSIVLGSMNVFIK